MLQALSLATLAGIRHGFFTRNGGVSQGVYASLNGGVGSNDAPDKVAENRARMATALGVARDRLLTAYQIHSPDVVAAETPWTKEARPRADAMVTRVPRLALGVSTADCGPLLFADAQARRDRRGTCRLARRLHRRDRGDDCRNGKTRRRALPHRRRARADDPPAELRSRPGIRRPLHAADAANARFFARVAQSRSRACSISPATSPPAFNAPASGNSRISGCATYADPERFFSFRRMTHRGEADYGRHINAIALTD